MEVKAARFPCIATQDIKAGQVCVMEVPLVSVDTSEPGDGINVQRGATVRPATAEEMRQE